MSDDFAFPTVALNQDVAALGKKGSGKSYAMKGLVERLLVDGRRVVVVDPMGHWFGLKAKADGTPGFPVVVAGGEHADVPLDTSSGARLGQVIAASDRSFVIDVSEIKRGPLIGFATAFFDALYADNREALWLVIEESDVFAPQSPSTDGSRAMHDAVDQIARRGRQRGFRLWSLTQRPARLSKDVLTQANSLLLMRTPSPHDRMAAEDWVRGHAGKAEATEVIGQLAALPVGEGFVYCPDLDILKRVKFPPIQSADTSSTPEAGAKQVMLGQLASVEVDEIRRALEPSPDVEKSGATKGAMPASASAKQLAEVRAAGHVEGYKKGHAEGMRVARALVRQRFEDLISFLDRDDFDAAVDGADVAIVKAVAAPTRAPAAAAPAPPAPATATDVPVRPQSGGAADKLMAALVKVHPLRVTWGQAAAIAGRLKTTGGYFNTGRRRLLAEGLVTEDAKGRIGLTAKSVALSGWKPSTTSTVDLMAAALDGGAARLFEVIRAHRGTSWESIATHLGLQRTGGYWNTAVRTLRNNEMILECNDRVYVAGWLEKERA